MMAAKVFFSYSHIDEALRDKLEVQLTVLKRQGLIEPWHDRRMIAGDELNFEIDKNLEEADVILLLVSPDFLASAYCYNIEKAHALRRVRDGTARLISIILRPCEWDQTDLPKYVLTPKDGKPITLWANEDEAFLDVARSIRKAIQEVKPEIPVVPSPTAFETPSLPRSSNLRMSKTFTDADRDFFIHDAFGYMAKFFDSSLAELKTRNKDIEVRFQQSNGSLFTAVIYKNGAKKAACTIFLGGMLGSHTISFMQGESTRNNSFNESLSIERDEQSLYLKPMGMSGKDYSHGYPRMSPIGAAEFYWAMLMEPLQR
jgi:hypothetical protein